MSFPRQLEETTERLGTDPLGRLILRLSLPSIISMVSISLYNLVDTFWVSRLGYQSVAAITIVMPFWVICIAFGVGTGVGSNALASRRFGEKNVESANRVAGHMFFLAFALGVLFLLVSNLFPDIIARLCGTNTDVIGMASQYIVILGWGIPFLFLGLIGRNIFAASGDTVRPMIFTLFGQICNVILDPCFIFGWGFFPEMGIGGAAMGTVISNILSAVMLTYFIAAHKTSYRLKLHHLFPRRAVIFDIYRVGLPAMVMEVTESIVFALFNHVVAGFGSIALAAVGIAGRIIDLVFMPILGTSHGLLPIVGYSLGAKLWGRLWQAVRLSSIWTAIFMVAATIFFEIFSPQIVALFTDDPELLAIAVPGMRIVVSSLIVVGPTIMFITTFQGLSKGRDAMILSLARQFIFFLPGLLLLTRFTGLEGVWFSMPISDTLGAAMAGWWLYREYRNQKKAGFIAEVMTF